jgi:hypothetical protein
VHVDLKSGRACEAQGGVRGNVERLAQAQSALAAPPGAGRSIGMRRAGE